MIDIVLIIRLIKNQNICVTLITYVCIIIGIIIVEKEKNAIYAIKFN